VLARAVSAHIQREVGTPLASRAPSAAGRLRVGYLSPDFRDHVVGRLARPLLEQHDRSAVEVFAYSLAPDDGSALRRALASAADRFRDVSALDDRTAAATIAGDGIDILVDLAGYTDGARPEILALRPAPVQVTYLGFAGSTGADYIDYALTDRVTTPAGSEDWWSEQLAFLPHTHFLYAPWDAPDLGTVSRQAYGLPSDAVVFCAFHSAHKIGPESFSAWAEILRRAPGSVLWLLDSGPPSGPICAARGRGRRACQAGGGAARARAASLARLAPSTSSSTRFLPTPWRACDALRMGVPAATLTGAPLRAWRPACWPAAGLEDLAAPDPRVVHRAGRGARPGVRTTAAAAARPGRPSEPALRRPPARPGHRGRLPGDGRPGPGRASADVLRAPGQRAAMRICPALHPPLAPAPQIGNSSWTDAVLAAILCA
jgi:hypothetical protein